MEKLLKAMIVILRNHNGECSNDQLLNELRTYDKYINQNEIDRVIRDYPHLFKRTSEIVRNGKTIVEGGVALTGDW